MFVDLGTGDGRLIGLVREQHPDARALGVDFSEPMLAHARERFAGDPLVELHEHHLAQPLALLVGTRADEVLARAEVKVGRRSTAGLLPIRLCMLTR